MFKLVVLCAFLAAVVAEPKPGVVLSAPWAGYSTYYGPATTLTRTASSVVHPSPFVYTAPVTYTHFIKKRSPQYLGYYGATPYYTSGPVVAPAFTTPLLSAAPVVSTSPLTYTTTHLIKKRSPDFLSTPFIAPTTYAAASAPLFASTYGAGHPWISSAPLLAHPLTYSTHLIKKRSAQLLTPYLAPTSYSHTSRIDVNHATPLAYSSHYLYPRVFGSPVVIAK